MHTKIMPRAGKLALFTTISSLALAVTTPSFAQQAPAASAEPERGIETVVVTAQRREENLQSVPLSVSAFSAAQIKARGLTDTVAPGKLSSGINVRALRG